MSLTKRTRTGSRRRLSTPLNSSTDDEGEENEGRVETALYTVGHSNRSAEEFTGLLRGNGVRVLADVRKLPGSNKSFRAYADHMETAEFREGVEALLAQARESPTAIMCSEAVWWRCHRALIADYLKSMGVSVYHIMGAGTTKPHPHTSAARVVDGRLSYEG